MKRIVLNSFISVLLLTLVGCGFQLRGEADLSNNIKTMRIEGISINQTLGLKLKRALVSNGVVIVDNAATSSSILKVLDHEFERRVLSVGSNAKVSEYELYSEIVFEVIDAQGNVIAERQSVQAQRDYQFNENEVLGRESEESFLREQLDQQLVQSLIRRLSAIK